MTTSIDNELETLAWWDVEALVECLGISTEEILAVPEFHTRAVAWIEENR